VKIRVVAPFDIPALDEAGCLEVAPGTTVGSLLRQLRAGHALAWILPAAVNGELAKQSHELAEGDVLVFLFPFAGG
jgi:molybdopterin converting factor small subunit